MKVCGKAFLCVPMTLIHFLGEGYFDDPSAKPSAVGTPMDSDAGASTTAQNPPPRGGRSRKAKTTKQRLAIIDGSGEP